MAEGAISKEDAKLSKKELKDKQAKKKYPSVAYEMAEKVQKRTQQEVRIAIPDTPKEVDPRVHLTVYCQQDSAQKLPARS